MNSNVHHSTNTMNLSAVCNLILSFEAPNFTKEKHWFRLQFYALQKYQLCYNSIIGLCLFLNGRLSEGRKMDILSLGIRTFLPLGRCPFKQTNNHIIDDFKSLDNNTSEIFIIYICFGTPMSFCMTIKLMTLFWRL